MKEIREQRCELCQFPAVSGPSDGDAMSLKNWRMKDGFVEIQSDEGRWFFPDCGYSCDYCQRCLGCLRKLYPLDDSVYSDNLEPHFHCPSSPDGDHHVIENPEKN